MSPNTCFMAFDNSLWIGILSSIVATLIVLITRHLYYKSQDFFPASRLFDKIHRSSQECILVYVRLTDSQGKNQFLEPAINISFSHNKSQTPTERVNITFVLS